MAKSSTKSVDKSADLQKQAEAILERAKERGVSSNYFFTTTFRRYQVQMQIMEALEKEILETGATVTKEYVKGRRNVYTNPAISEYNRTSTAANNTVSTLISIVEKMGDEPKKESKLQTLFKELSNDE